MQPGSVILTQEGMVFGTPEFMSPEQAQGRTLDARSDIYSLAVILYETLTGKLPFTARTPMEYIQKHVIEPPITLGERVPERKFDRGLEQALAKALSKKPGRALPDRGRSSRRRSRPLRRRCGRSYPVDPRLVFGRGRAPEFTSARLRSAQPSKGPGTGLLVGVAVGCLMVGILRGRCPDEVLEPLAMSSRESSPTVPDSATRFPSVHRSTEENLASTKAEPPVVTAPGTAPRRTARATRAALPEVRGLRGPSAWPSPACSRFSS